MLNTEFKKLTVPQIVAVSEAEGLSLSSSDKRTRHNLYIKWEGQDEAIRARLIARARSYQYRFAQPKTASHPKGSTQDATSGNQAPLDLKAIGDVIRATGLNIPLDAGASVEDLNRFWSGLDADTLGRVIHALQTKPTTFKRKFDETEGDANDGDARESVSNNTSSDRTPVVLEFSASPTLAETVKALTEGPFLAEVDDATIRSCTNAFIDSTNNTSMKKQVCVVCARRLFIDHLKFKRLRDIPSPSCLKPAQPHPHQFIWQGMILYEHAIDMETESGHVCSECLQELEQSRMPSLSLANNMWIGNIPPVLAALSLPEQVLIARYFPAAYMVKLYPKNQNLHLDPRALTSGLKGNVTTYPLDVKALSNFIDGSSLPPHPRILAATIGITFVGLNNAPEKALRGLFRVSRAHVRNALLWLKANNPLYRHISINENNLSILPEDEVPKELRQVVKIANDGATLEKEHAGYVPQEPMSDNTVEGACRNDVDSANEEIDESIDETEPPEVIPLQSLGMIDTETTGLSDSDLLAAALKNTGDQLAQYEEATIKHGTSMVNEYPRVHNGTGLRYAGTEESPNHLLGAFPVNFPYGQGGLEIHRERPVPYQKHAQWALLYADNRFRTDLQFIFQTFGVLLKRQILSSTKVQIKRSAYRRHADTIRQLKSVDLIKASVEESKRLPFSNPIIRLFRTQLSGLRSHVMGTDESRRGIRAQIWGCTLKHGPPSLWLTINPSDIHDPLAQVLAGEEIDLDEFEAKNGPDAATRALNIASDPFAASEFFHHTIKTLLKHEFGLAVNSKGHGRLHRTPGIMGTIMAYIGTVEAQGRGMLHLHLLLWLEGAPTSQEMTAALKTEAFRDKVRRWITQNITADIEGLSTQAIDELPRNSSCSFSRPPDPRTPTYDSDKTTAIRSLSRSLQVHTCKGHGCLQVFKGVQKCKRGVPFPKAAHTWVTEAGEWGPARIHNSVVAYNPTLLLTLRCNHDVKLLTNVSNTGGIAWYITLYATKKQQKNSNSSAVLARRLAFHSLESMKDPVVDDLNRKMINRCANALSRDQEFSAPEVVGYLMGWGDRYISHHFVSIYWDSVVYALKDTYPELKDKQLWKTVVEVENEGNEQSARDGNAIVRPGPGRLEVHDQKDEYKFRPVDMETFNYWDYFLDTYEVTSGRGSKRGHETLPQFVGKWFPRRSDPDDEALYCASMLALFKPWRELGDLKAPGKSLKQSFEDFLVSCPQRLRRVMDNMEYYYTSAEAANRDRDALDNGPAAGIAAMQDDDERQEDGAQETFDAKEITDEELRNAKSSGYTDADERFATRAMFFALNAGIFEDSGAQVTDWANVSRTADYEDLEKYNEWSECIKNYTRKTEEWLPTPVSLEQQAQIQGPSQRSAEEAGLLPVMPNTEDRDDDLQASQVVGTQPPEVILNKEQSRALEIVKRHVIHEVKLHVPEPLRMVVNGCGGTGKSALIDVITATFMHLRVPHWLAKMATSGVAATRIGGTTVHSWAALGPNTKAGSIAQSSSKTLEKRTLHIRDTRYLIIDEFSMLTKSFLENLSEVSAGFHNTDKQWFGNSSSRSVARRSDLHQFPPVIRKDALYYPDPPEIGTSIGRHLFEGFSTVVTLTQQMRVQDEAWTAMLNRLRVGGCTDSDIAMVKSLVLTEGSSETPDFSSKPWSDAVLVTSRNSVRDRWNSAAIRQHCRVTKNRLYISPAEDTVGKDRREVDRNECLQILRTASRHTGKLSLEVELAIGMRGMVLLNIATESDLANGSRGTIVDIILDARETTPAVEDGTVTLKYPPACVLFKLDHSRFPRFEGLGANEIPIFPSETSFTVTDSNGQRRTIRRRQLALTPAYAFTDYKAQGQTIEHVIVDLAESTRNSLDPFHAYVALSCSRGHSTIRLLRDFRAELLQEHPSEHLVPEDARLAQLDNVTRVAYEKEQRDREATVTL
ncbi:hypothetical protein CCMSSC00406_0007097 [Pleurotus cornucopiae]|uniref:Uncharacterized protein n=1 Tax=Pleurotus cornucopiae TaxID=5321 RepID=A0ACB7J584_PLECO|nr:hypothetical protein CCMSSC00406_0007097 [Pleurotus cornucopiae]